MAEQNFVQAVRIADRGYVIVHGKIAFEGKSAEALNNNELIREFYLGLTEGILPFPPLLPLGPGPASASGESRDPTAPQAPRHAYFFGSYG